ncbi:MAG: hypothetical protein A3H69_00390 [Candidatus Sungbacteria bacterium RIFCSPLOWO2_02_FULL_47_9]|nr:MAG: Membrane-associated zinc metalloprotease [Parcubacteria group bacterium GW2011_GWA2_47_10]OHA00022.1 MAG: hypothetical protein A3D57_03795 [Candidatus Sungbacteria bacterium RIFCSPHIGHO2_02_FULL_46_12]OHA05120.1 MAG: hypothetical protein A3A28_00660 [Candidatus Sungbacteria bacterium RIFCSPLOWO2_01_FULL_47_32]OHA09792.1 MAG: hypothetical protein A3H69_00390 [Candidatus Sungbacteria bacterium RIFCSPLOWO2_02_FULL_47_9]
MGVILFFVVLGVLIAFHEFGHFLFAKLFGVRVIRFSIGFGPVLLSKKLGETEYALSLIPLGGYVQMWGESLPVETGKETEAESYGPERRFESKPIWQRFVILVAGPVFNLLLAAILFCSAYALYGIPSFSNVVGAVVPGSPAERAGMKAGDEIRFIAIIEEGTEMLPGYRYPTERWEDVKENLQKSRGREMELIIIRNGSPLFFGVKPEKLSVTNAQGKTESYIGIGVSPASPTYDRNPVRGVVHGLRETWKFTELTAAGLWSIVSGKLSAKESVGGPIMIAGAVSEANTNGGFFGVMMISALLSINLFILNLLPIPMLDGGQLPFLLIEKLRGRPVSFETQIKFRVVGLVLLGALMIFAFINDILRVFGG